MKISERTQPWVGILLIAAVATVLGQISSGARTEETAYLTLIGNFSEAALHTGFYALWGIYTYRRVNHRGVRDCLTVSVILIILWFSVRTVKYEIVPQATICSSLCWYSYYVATILLPLMSFLAADFIGKDEEMPLPGRMKMLICAGLFLTAVVMTNNLHDLVFRFSDGMKYHEGHYTYAPLFPAVIAWEIGFSIAALLVLMKKCRTLSSSPARFLPLLPVAALILYGFVYVTDISLVKPWLGDMTAFSCMMVIMIWESCFTVGLVQTNMGYDRFFQISTLKAQIADENHSVLLRSLNTGPVDSSLLEKADSGKVNVGNGIFLCSAPVSGGYCYWEQDLSQLTRLKEQLSGIHETLEEYHDLVCEETRQKKKRKKLEETERLYALVRRETSAEFDCIKRMLASLEDEADIGQARSRLYEISVLGAYLKRMVNMVFLADGGRFVDAGELKLCISESIQSIRLAGAEGIVRANENGSMPVETAMHFYRFFEDLIWQAVHSLRNIYCSYEKQREGYMFCMVLDCGQTELSLPAAENKQAGLERDEDGTWYAWMFSADFFRKTKKDTGSADDGKEEIR